MFRHRRARRIALDQLLLALTVSLVGLVMRRNYGCAVLKNRADA